MRIFQGRGASRAVMARVALTLLATVLLGAWPATAQAHTGLVASTPSAGDTVALTTPRLVLVFDDELVVDTGQVVVRGPAGDDVTTAAPTITGSTLEVPIDLTTAGSHQVSYRVTGSDGHPIVASFGFDAVREGAGRGDATAALRTAVAGPADPVAPGTGGAEPAEVALWALVAVALLAGLALVHHRTAHRDQHPS